MYPAQLSDCAVDYYQAIAKPFSPEARGVCLPIFPTRESQKSTGFMSGTAHVGTTGYGFIAVAPCIANDKYSVWKTSPSYNQNYIEISSVLPVGVSAHAMTDLPYRSAQLRDGTDITPASVRGRIVTTGLRLRYTGTNLNKGGRMVAYVSPSHGNLNGESVDEMTARAGCLRLQVTSSWSEFVVFSNTSDEMEYPGHEAGSGTSSWEVIRACYPLSNKQYIATGVPETGGVPMVVMMTGVTGNEFEYEVVTHCEFIGAATAASNTPSHCDVDGLSRVQNAAAGATVKRAADADRTNAKSMAQSMLESGLSMAWANREVIAKVASRYGQPRRLQN